MPSSSKKVVAIENVCNAKISLLHLFEKYCPRLSHVNSPEYNAAATKVFGYLKRDEVFKDSQDDFDLVVKHFLSLLKTKEETTTITLFHSEGFNILKMAEIMYLEGNNNYTIIHTPVKKYIVSKTLKTYEEQLAENLFQRIHKSTIINLRHIKNYSLRDMNVTMSDSKVFSISRRRAIKFSDKANQYSI